MKKKTKVVQLTSVHYIFDTRIFHKISKSLVKAGYRVDLLAQHSKDEIVDGVNIKALPISKRKIDRPLRIIPLLFKKCLKYPAGTIFHFHDPELIPLGLLLKWFGYQVIYDVHENTPRDFLTKEWFSPRMARLMSFLIEKLEFVADKKLDSIITTTSQIAERFQNSASVQVRNYPIIEDYLHKLDDVEKVDGRVIYVGDITYRRGVKEMIESIELSSGSHLVLGGRFSPPEIFQEVMNLSGWERCQFLGWLQLKEVWQQLLKSKIGLVTIKITESHITQLPVKLFEYMLAALPVISSDIPMYRAIIEESNCGILVDPDSPKEIAEAIDWIMEHSEEAKKMGESGRKAVLEKYNWANEEKKLLKLYAELENRNN